MGEYALYNGEQVKIGTCEDLYYLRYEHRKQVTPLSGSIDPSSDAQYTCRFRFPWPDEDHTAAPGRDNERHDYDRSCNIPGASMPEDVKHYSVQFKASPGYLLSLPCPESPSGPEVARNGFVGAVHLCQLKPLRDGRVVPIMKCGGCGAKWRLEDNHEIEALIVALRSEGDRRERAGSSLKWWDDLADRIAAYAKLSSDVPC